MPLLPWISWLPATVSPTMFFITATGKPLGPVSFQLFADKVPKTAENLHTVNTGERGYGYKIPAFIELFRALCTRVVTSHATMAQAGKSVYWEKFDDENFILKHTGPGTLSMANAGPDTRVPSFSSALRRPSGWTASMWSSAGWKTAWTLWQPWNATGPGMAGPARRSPLLTVDNS